jgi:hypothetical protein
MIKFIKELIFKLEVFFNTKKLKDLVMYQNKETNTYVMLMKEDKLLNIFVDGLLINVPINNKITSEASFTKALGAMEDLNLENNSIEDLEDMLKYYEDIEDFKKCSKIKKVIKNKTNNYSE